MTSAALAKSLGSTRNASKPRGFWASAFHRLTKNRLAMIALIGLVFMAAVSFAAPLFEQAMNLNRDEIDLLNNYARPSAAHWFGTDEYGRDYFIRFLYGGQVSMLMGFAVAMVILAIGVPIGMVAAYYGRFVDDAFNWLVQILVTVPVLYLLIFVSALIIPNPLVLAFIIGAFGWTGNARQARGMTFQLKRSEYVTAARSMGARDSRLIFRHILPNILSLMIILAGFDIVAGALAETSLSYLGLGVRPPVPSWGNMLSNAFAYMFKAPYLVVFPVLGISFFVLFVYMLADGLRDAFDPGLRE